MAEYEMNYRLVRSPLGTSMDDSTTKTAGTKMDERTLVRSMIRGDEAAFRQFCDAYIPALHRFATSRLGGDRDLISEIVQNTLVKAISKLPTFRGEAALFTWLCACCKTEIAAHFRKNRGKPAEVEWSDEAAPLETPLNRTPPEGPERRVLRNESATLVHSALDLLPPRYRRVLEWKYLDDLPVNEIADRMRLRPKAAESLLTRARGSFREIFGRLQTGRRHERKRQR
jgi:RNA polymerase sigma-70 factor (ECF subfamily)